MLIEIEGKNWTAEQIAGLIADRATLKRPLPASAVREMMAAGRIFHMPKGTMIAQRGDQEPSFFLLLSGVVRLTLHTQNGYEFVNFFIEPGNFWGVHACLGDFPESNDSIAEDDVEVLMIGQAAIQGIVQNNSPISEAMMQLLCGRMQMLLAVTEQFATWTPRARLAWRLLEMARILGEDRDGMTVAVSQDALASMVSLSRQRTNMLLRQFEADGWLKIGYRQISHIKLDKLRALLVKPEDA